MVSCSLRKSLLKIAAGVSICSATFVVVPTAAKAAECPDSGTVSELSAYTDGCYHTPTRYVVKVYEMGLCTSDPLSGTDYDGSSCTATLSSTGGSEVNLAGGATATLSGTSSRPPVGTYEYAYIKIANTFGLKGSYKLGSTTYCSAAGGSIDSSSGCTPANWTETLLEFSGDGCSSASADDFKASESLSGGTMKARLVDDDSYVTSTSCGGATNPTLLVGSFKPTTAINIAETTGGLEVSFKVTKSGMTIIPGGAGSTTVVGIGGGPFQPSFVLY